MLHDHKRTMDQNIVASLECYSKGHEKLTNRKNSERCRIGDHVQFS